MDGASRQSEQKSAEVWWNIRKHSKEAATLLSDRSAGVWWRECEIDIKPRNGTQ